MGLAACVGCWMLWSSYVLRPRKHRYGKNPAVPVPGTLWVRILPGYRCMRTPGVPVFGQKKKNSGTVLVRVGSGRVRYGAKPKRRRFRLKTEALFSFSATPITASKLRSLSSALCLSLPPPPVSSDLSPLLSVSHFLRWSSALCLSVPSISQCKLFCFYYLTLHVATSPHLMV